MEQSHNIQLQRCAPFMFHGDEGRGKKKVAVLCMSAHPVLGKGVQTRRKRKLDEQEQQMNYSGMTHCGRYLLSVLPKQYYESDIDLFHSVVECLCKDLRKLWIEGLLGHDNERYHVCIINCKGEWPFLHKIAGLTRSFYNQPKHGDNAGGQVRKTKDVGVCHICQAGQENCPFEDTSHSCEWQYTLGVDPPWKQPPKMLDYCAHDAGFPEMFFHPDPWHCFHLGEGRGLVCNAMKLLLEVTPGRNTDVRLDYLYQQYRSYCLKNGCQTYASKFTANLFGISANDYPSGGWTKGNFTTSLVKWLGSYLRQNDFEPGSLLRKTVALAVFVAGCFFPTCLLISCLAIPRDLLLAKFFVCWGCFWDLRAMPLMRSTFVFRCCILALSGYHRNGQRRSVTTGWDTWNSMLNWLHKPIWKENRCSSTMRKSTC